VHGGPTCNVVIGVGIIITAADIGVESFLGTGKALKTRILEQRPGTLVVELNGFLSSRLRVTESALKRRQLSSRLLDT
jgi:hypothetical protein